MVNTRGLPEEIIRAVDRITRRTVDILHRLRLLVEASRKGTDQGYDRRQKKRDNDADRIDDDKSGRV